MTHVKDFAGWHTHKQHLDKEKPAPTFKEREIWWCSVGINVGHEIDGKNRYFNRPILVIRKFNPHIFWGVPLTTQMKNNPFYLPLDFKGQREQEKKRCVMLSHLRLYDSKRLHDKMGRISPQDFQAVKDALKNLL
jgi:mRNA interferase MazF